MNESKKLRQSNVELLRIIAMSMVIFLHYFNPEIGGAFKYVQKGTVNDALLQFLEAVSICAVNLFVMISGYFLSRSNRRTIGKALGLLFQVVFYSQFFYGIQCAFHPELLTVKGILVRLLPSNWFVVLYVVIYLISPLLNLAFDHLGTEMRKHAVILLLILFSVWPTAVDLMLQIAHSNALGLSTIGMQGSAQGYTITQFVLCYFIGMATHELDLRSPSVCGKEIGRGTLAGLAFAEAIILSVWGYLNAHTGREYCNPLVIAEAWTLLLLFLKTEIKPNRSINHIAECAFSVYLIHNHCLPYLKIEQYVNAPIAILFLHITCSVLGIIAFSFAFDKCFHKIFGTVLSRVNRFGAYSY